MRITGGYGGPARGQARMIGSTVTIHALERADSEIHVRYFPSSHLRKFQACAGISPHLKNLFFQ